MKNTWECIIENVRNSSEEVFISIPDDLLSQLDLKIGDQLSVEIECERITISQKGKVPEI